MAADTVGFLTVVAMGLFTVFSIIGGYLLLNTAVTSIARQNSYYTFVRVCDTISDSMQSTSASATNLVLSPQYVIFSAYASDYTDFIYPIFDGQRLNHIAVNHEDYVLFDEILESSTGQSILSTELPTNRQELLKCVDDVCLCIGEMTTYLLIEDEFLIPNACVEICWGENTQDYDSCLFENYNTEIPPRELMNFCNNELANDNNNALCQECVEYMNDYEDNFQVAQETGFNVLVTNFETLTSPNSENIAYLQDFTEATKYSFIPYVIECNSMYDLAISAARNGYCGSSQSPYLFNFLGEDEELGIFTILTTNQVNTTSINNNDLLIGLLNIEYNQLYNGVEELFSPDACYSINTFIQSEVSN
jgi:hypothetical protein